MTPITDRFLLGNGFKRNGAGHYAHKTMELEVSRSGPKTAEFWEWHLLGDDPCAVDCRQTCRVKLPCQPQTVAQTVLLLNTFENLESLAE